MINERLKRQICLLLSFMMVLSGMCLFSEQADACFSYIPALQERSQSTYQGEKLPVNTQEMPGGMVLQKILLVTPPGVKQNAVLLSGTVMASTDFSCTGEMLGVKILSARQAVTRFFNGLRNKIILALSFIGRFLFVLILFKTVVDRLEIGKKNGHTVIIQYIYHKDGKKDSSLQYVKYKNIVMEEMRYAS